MSTEIPYPQQHNNNNNNNDNDEDDNDEVVVDDDGEKVADEDVDDVVEQVIGTHCTTATKAHAVAAAGGVTPKKRRLCRYPGCTKVIKSQGHCQRHGARAKRCKVEGCEKQAQGTHDGMCKRHWKQVHFPAPPPRPEEQPPPPEGESVYDHILPQSISYRPAQAKKPKEGIDPLDPPAAPDGVTVMPLVAFLRKGSLTQPAGWHRNTERRARGMFPVSSLSSQLEPWERQLALVEILLLSGGTPFANFKDLAHAWGREKGFHHLLATSVCERRGDIERKKRSDAGRTMTTEQREAFKHKLKKARQSKDPPPPTGGGAAEEAGLAENGGQGEMKSEVLDEMVVQAAVEEAAQQVVQEDVEPGNGDTHEVQAV